MERENTATGTRCLSETRKFVSAAKKFGAEVKYVGIKGTWSVLGRAIELSEMIPTTKVTGWKFATTDDSERARLRPTGDSIMYVVMEFKE